MRIIIVGLLNIIAMILLALGQHKAASLCVVMAILVGMGWVLSEAIDWGADGHGNKWRKP